MSILRYYKKIENWELPPNNEVLAVIRNATGGKLIYQYLQCILAPVRNHERWSICHPKVRLMRWK